MIPPPAPPASDRRYGPGFWVALAIGSAVMAWGAVLYLDATPDARRRIDFAKWLVGLDLAHDALLAPAVVLAGAVLARAVRGAWRAPLQAALITTGVVLLVAALPLMDTAAVARNPTIQPLDYTTATLTVLAAVWGGAGVWGAARQRRRRRRRS